MDIDFSIEEKNVQDDGLLSMKVCLHCWKELSIEEIDKELSKHGIKGPYDIDVIWDLDGCWNYISLWDVNPDKVTD